MLCRRSAWKPDMAKAKARIKVNAMMCIDPHQETKMQSAKLAQFGFSTADAEDINLACTDGHLCLNFKDWREQPVEVWFHDTIAFKWQEAESHGPEERDDCAYVIEGSKWLAEHIKQNIVKDTHGYRHYKLCFNACGVLEVLSNDVVTT